MAIRPPTSPTTVMGGFSLGINTGEKAEKQYDQCLNPEGKHLSVAEFQYLHFRTSTYAEYIVLHGGDWIIIFSLCAVLHGISMLG